MNGALQIDEWPWGRERILWGFDPAHAYTYKTLEPRKGRRGCASLQYHREKSESWVVFRGTAWVLVAAEGVVCTRIMRAGDLQNLPAGMIHRFTGVSDDVVFLEASTPDRHAADKSVTKDVVRLHCYRGRPCAAPRDVEEVKILARCVEVSDEAMRLIEQGHMPPEHNLPFLLEHGAYALL